ncbi:MgtC/SapB family protein [Gaetbulibacter aestuarii]|uniref:DUF4010 domain-containing protein n=1 Tax=Gaetbulibacter aestuarii TaxID=1502358 RepID=A0ABW7MXM5_9FLAO
MNSLVDIQSLFPQPFYLFIMVAVFSFLIGLEQRTKFSTDPKPAIFGTDRTFTFIGILGFVLYIIQPKTLIPFLLGAVLLGALLLAFYIKKIAIENDYGLTTVALALITYCLAPLVATQPIWLVIIVVVLLLIMEEIKKPLLEFSEKVHKDEFITLAKFLLMSGVILPLVPNKPISEHLDFSLYNFWLAIVAISAISYGSYLLKKYVFPKSGIILTGILGGMYSSTATTFILAKKSKEINDDYKLSAAIVLSTSMMFVRIFILALIFNMTIAKSIAPAFGILFLLSLIASAILLRLAKNNKTSEEQPIQMTNTFENPLELKTAFIFGFLFVFFSILTQYVTEHYSVHGIKILSYLVGVTDIDPFIINIFQGHFNVTQNVLAIAIINAVTSNNLLKMIYALTLSKRSIHKYIIFSFAILIIFGIILAYWI